MALKKVQGTMNVLESAKQRIKNVFSNNVPVYMSFSGGKDSLCMSHITYSLILSCEIDAKQLTVIFIDEEDLYKSMLEAAYRWRKKFLRVGAKFNWYCLPVKQVSVIDHLSQSESWITWDERVHDVWMREPPPFAIRNHPLVPYAGACNYQTFCERLTRNGIQMIGLRATESIQRLKAISSTKLENSKIYPIYDWHDTDVWLYIKENNLEFPEIYIRLYEAGVNRAKLRLCCFFGDSSIVGLKWVAESEPELWEKIERRYPNAYLVLLYWDSEMFRRSSRKRRELEKDLEEQDYKSKLYDVLFLHPENYTIPKDTQKYIKNWKRLIQDYSEYMIPKHFKICYETIISGDPKARSFRAIYADVYKVFADTNRKEQAERDGRKTI